MSKRHRGSQPGTPAAAMRNGRVGMLADALIDLGHGRTDDAAEMIALFDAQDCVTASTLIRQLQGMVLARREITGPPDEEELTPR